MPRPRFLMCPPTYFGVEYVINPWMEGQIHQTRNDNALAQWNALFETLSTRAEIELLEPQPGLPDLVFTANAAIVQGSSALLARFKHPERQREEPHNAQWLARHGFEVHTLPDDLPLEGAGDALFDRELGVLWFGHGHRSTPAARGVLERQFKLETVSLALVDPRFYHLDTCFCPLEGGYLLWYPPAFDAAGQATVRARIPATRRLEISDVDATDFACNAVNAAGSVVLNRASPALRGWLERHGFAVLETPTSEFLRAGGSTKCMTLRLDERVPGPVLRA